MDWQGQKVAELLMQIMLLSFAVIAFASGYVMASFQLMILMYAGGVVLTTLIIVPNWPFFNRHPLKWLDPSEVEKNPKPQPSPNVTQKKKTVKNDTVGLARLPDIIVSYSLGAQLGLPVCGDFKEIGFISQAKAFL
ncbi:hypothetical protein RJT34_03763 [Clitoria ternatea]|uniref:Signal peptidase complex subunit 1 n=1 Tax=Clitoria ternatea TaxID=43366 RepID=A0AAN9KLC0_CLITE